MSPPVNQMDTNRRKRGNKQQLAMKIDGPQSPPLPSSSSGAGTVAIRQPNNTAIAQPSGSSSQNSMPMRDDFEPPVIPLLGFIIHANRFAKAMEQEKAHRQNNQ
jgi:hypothetical protein